MRHFRNPKFAPESLERKLNPSGIVPIHVAVEVHNPIAHVGNPTHLSHTVVSNSGTSSAHTSSHGQHFLRPDSSIPDGNGDPPVDIPTIPTGPDQPA